MSAAWARAAALLLVAAAAFASGARAAPISGSWERLAPAGAGPVATRWASAAAVGGCLIVTGGSGAGGNATLSLDTVALAWSPLPPLPDAVLAPATLPWGGLLALFGGEGAAAGRSDTTLLLSTTNSSGGWLATALPDGAFGARNGHRAVGVGGFAFVMGGWNGSVYFNDLWGADFASLVLGTTQADGSPPAWVPLAPSGAPGAPPPRSGFSWDVLGGLAYVFGGTSFTPATPSAPAVRTVFGDVWVWTPPAAPLLAPGRAGSWAQLSPRAGPSGAPPCRWGHTAGFLAGVLYIHGGVSWDACGAGAGGQVSLDDLWALDVSAAGGGTWQRIAAAGAPPPALGVPAGAVVGSALYLYGAPAGAPAAAAALWRWSPDDAPPASCGGCAGGGGAAAVVALAVTNAATLAALAGALALLWRQRGAAVARGLQGLDGVGGAYFAVESAPPK